MQKNHFEKYLGQPLFPETRIVLSDGQVHKFDLASADRSILIECKSYTYTETGNEPPAKLAHAKTDALLLRSSTARRKIIVFDDDEHPKKGSLARLFARRAALWVHDVEVWRHWDGTFKRVSTCETCRSRPLAGWLFTVEMNKMLARLTPYGAGRPYRVYSG
jgi:hypothetical protein